MQEYLRKDFSKILKQGGLDARRMMKETDSTVARVYDRNLEPLDLSIDLYGPFARILDYSDPALSSSEKDDIIDLVHRFLYIEKDKIIYKLRKKREEGCQHEKENESLVIEVRENSHFFKVELLKYADTGLFLDHANTRKSVEESSFGLKVLNLFSYTGSFSVYAASGGAERVDSVDLSNVYTEWARENMDANGFFDASKYPTVASDAEAYIENAVKEKKRWDLIIFDPPSFSNSHKAHDFDLKKDYLHYLYNLTKILTDGGVVIFSENLASFSIDKGKLKPYYKISDLTDEMRAFGFSRKRSLLKIMRLEKVKEYQGDVMKRIMDDESLERLTLDKINEEKKAHQKKTEQRRYEKKPFSSDRKSSYKGYQGDANRRECRADSYKDSSFRRYERDDKSYDERRRSFNDEKRSYHEEKRRRYGSSDEIEKRERPGRRGEDRRGREHSEYRKRREDEKRYSGYEARRSYASERSERRRERKAPVPYGYDEFRKSKGRNDKNSDL